VSARPFRFEPLLDFAERREEQQMLVLASVLLEEQRATTVLATLAAEREAELTRRSTEARVAPEQRQVADAYLDRLGMQIDAQRGALAEVHDRVAQARAALIEIEREKQSLEHLREQDEATALDAANRREASAVDDLNMTRHGRNTSHGPSGLGGD